MKDIRLDRIREAILKSDLSYAELSKLTGISKSSLQRYATGEIKKISIECVEAIAKATDTSAEYLMNWNSTAEINLTPVSKQRKIPLLGTIACGKPIFAEEHNGEYINVPEEYDADFALICRGDSMEPLIFDGDTVLIRSQLTVTDGDIGAVLIDDEVTLKHIYYNADTQTLRLTPENKKYSPLIYSGRNVTYAQILGRVMYSYRKF